MTHDKESVVVLADRPTLAGYFGLSNRLDFIVFMPLIIAKPAEIARLNCHELFILTAESLTKGEP